MATEITKRLYELYKTGKYTHQEIADLVGVSYNHACRYYNLKIQSDSYIFPKPPRHQFFRKSTLNINVERGYKLYQSGMTLEEIGKLYGNISRERVRQIFDKHGKESRPRGYPKKLHVCAKGHTLGAKEYCHACPKCKQEKKEYRAKGLHLKTHCIHGHEFTPENIIWGKYTSGKPQRVCKSCHKVRTKKYFDKNREKIKKYYREQYRRNKGRIK